MDFGFTQEGFVGGHDALASLADAGLGGSALHDRPEVADLVSLLRALVNPNDPVALVGVLRSPLGGCRW